MAGPASYNTPERIIKFAMLDSGLLQKGEEPNGEDYATYVQNLNDVINTEQTQGLKLWANTIVPITLTKGLATYVLGPGGAILTTKPIRAFEAYYSTAQGISRPLDLLGWRDYNELPNKTQEGAIIQFFPDKQLANIVVNFWLVPDTQAATGHVDLLVQQQLTNMVQLNDPLSFPVEWFMFLRWALADDICSGQSEAIMSRCQQKAALYRQALEDWDVEDAPTRFQPDTQRGYAGNPFR